MIAKIRKTPRKSDRHELHAPTGTLSVRRGGRQSLYWVRRCGTDTGLVVLAFTRLNLLGEESQRTHDVVVNQGPRTVRCTCDGFLRAKPGVPGNLACRHAWAAVRLLDSKEI